MCSLFLKKGLARTDGNCIYLLNLLEKPILSVMRSELFRSFLHLWCLMSFDSSNPVSLLSLFSNFVGFSVVSNPLDSLFMKQKLSKRVGEYLLALSIGDGVVWFIRANCVANEALESERNIVFGNLVKKLIYFLPSCLPLVTVAYFLAK